MAKDFAESRQFDGAPEVLWQAALDVLTVLAEVTDRDRAPQAALALQPTGQQPDRQLLTATFHGQ
ncbi:MAG: hypothetical protein ACR2QK_13145, partial [Acidimicrobiales bacterium]